MFIIERCDELTNFSGTKKGAAMLVNFWEDKNIITREEMKFKIIKTKTADMKSNSSIKNIEKTNFLNEVDKIWDNKKKLKEYITEFINTSNFND